MERWKTNPRRPGYDVSTKGRVKNNKTGRIMKTQVNDNGYEVLQLHHNKHYSSERVHRLVAETFIEGGSPDLDVNHIDGDKLNNNVENLEWCTRKENIHHAFENGLKKRPESIKIRIVETGEVFDSILACSEAIGGDRCHIRRCTIEKYRTCKGYHFELV